MRVNTAHKSVQDPIYIEGNPHPLGIQATLNDLPQYAFTVEADSPIAALIEPFSAFHDLPGVVVKEPNRISVLSRQQFLESLLQLGHTEQFTQGLVRSRLSRTSRNPIILPGDTTVLIGAQKALKRPKEEQNEPVVVIEQGQYYLLDSDLLNVAHWHIRGVETQIRYERLQMQILQSEKMAALGRLVDGVAHEILDPVSFIWGNLSYINEYAQQQSALISAYEKAVPAPPSAVQEVKEQIEFDYLKEDFPAALKSARSGAHRLRQLATSLQNFCHIDEVHPRPTDINSLLDSTLRLLRNRITSPISIERCYDRLPPVPCFPGQLSQVFMNILTNAVDSLLAQAQQESQLPTADFASPEITVTTTVCSAETAPSDTNIHVTRWISIIISDNGPGLPAEMREQILESFTTERRLKKETGLAMSYQIVTAKHGGRLWLRSVHESDTTATLDKSTDKVLTGTEFEILLPLTQSID